MWSEPCRENEPARPKVLNRDLSRIPLVHRRKVVERHAIQLHFQEPFHRQGSPRVREADDHPVDVVRSDDGGDVAHLAE